jgi:UDP-N-acetylmuramoylalanine--D-glutamate ligase
MRIAILGYAGQGQSAYEYWNNNGNELTICDKNTGLELPDGVKAKLGDDYLQGLGEFDLIVRTPALHPRDIITANPKVEDILDRITTNTNEFFRVCPSKNIIGVTGTKGKGTTSTLIAKMLEAAGKRVHLGGNIGIPPLELLKNNIQADDWVVLELANFQLIDLKYSPPFAVCLMVVPEHMDWHADMEEYVTAKQQLFRWQTTNDIAVYYGANKYSSQIANASPGHKIPYMHAPGAAVFMGNVTIDGQTICKTDELKLLGKHNWQNVCAAVTTVWQITQDFKAIRSVLTSFTGLEHRLELVRELDGVRYYDDSFGTTPETAVVAIEAFNQPKVVILGGSDKGSNYNQLVKTIKHNNVRAVVAIGKMGPKITTALREQGYDQIVEGGKTMREIVQIARAQAHPGDIILLSTGCASFDLFKNYKDRGDQFKKAVLALS